MTSRQNICIGGLACRLPKSENALVFWENLFSGRDMVGPTRWPQKLFGLPAHIGAIPNISFFDNDYFNIPDEEVPDMNPMLRHLLEVTYECCVDSCLPLTSLQETRTGVYLACCNSDTDFLELSPYPHSDNRSLSPFLAGELVKFLGVTGPSVTVDTASSSSMAALHLAVADLRAGKCDYAFIAGCDLILNPHVSRQMLELGMLSHDGKTCVFDAKAAGCVRAEGVTVLLLASESSILQRVYCNVVDIGVNNDGNKMEGLGLASSERQVELIQNLYERNGIDVSQVHYVEANGSATQVRDAAEAAVLQKVFCQQREEPLLVGCVKSNMGQSEATAGLAAIIKCILAMHHGVLPANQNFTTPNPEIPGLVSGQLKVVTTPTKLKGQYIGINSFGHGGVNSHVILEAYERKDTEDFEQIGGHMLVPLTASCAAEVSSIVSFVGNNRYNNSLLGMLSRSLLSCDAKQPIRGFMQIGPQEDDVQVQCQMLDDVSSVMICLQDFMGSKIAVNSDLLEVDCFMTALKECAQHVRMFDPDLDLVSVLRNKEPLLSITRVGMVAAATLLISLEACLETAGLIVDQLMAGGLSEIVGAYIDGCLSLDQCLLIYNCIGRHLEQFSQQAVDRWQIYDVRLEVEQAYQLGPWVQVLNIQDADHVTISVETNYKHKVLSKIHQKGGFYNILPSNVPVYSGYMKELAHKIKEELKDIIPCPVHRSCHLKSCQMGGQTYFCRQLYDTDYISSIICKPVNQMTALQKQTATSLCVQIIPTSSPALLFKLHTPGDLDFTVASDLSGISQNQSTLSDKGLRMQTGLRYVSVSTQSELDESDTTEEGEYIASKGQNTITCMASTRSFCQVLGELHMHGQQIDVSLLYPTISDPLGIETPCLSPLVAWQHNTSWYIPPWTAFSFTVKDDEKARVYFTGDMDIDDIDETNNPLAVLLYHSWRAVAKKLKKGPVDDLPVKLYHLEVADDSLLLADNVIEARIEVFPGSKSFVASFGEDKLLLKGKFEVKETFQLPCLSGYDLDINENVKQDHNDSSMECYKSEINWEDSWPDFLSDFVEFAGMYLKNSDLLEMVVEPRQHKKEAKDCPTFLAVVENTGICRSGGCVLLFNTPLTADGSEMPPAKVAIEQPGGTLINQVMVYGLQTHKSPEEQLILYQAEKKIEDMPNSSVIGLVNLEGVDLMREFPLPDEWEPENLEILVPFILASYLLFDVAQVQIGQTVLILPPIDTVSVYLISLASQFGCSVFASTYDTENLQCLEALFPNVRVLPGDRLHENLMVLTQGDGVRLCLRLTSGDVLSALECVSDNGHLIQCIPSETGLPSLSDGFKKNIKVSLVKPLDAFSNFMKKSLEDISVLMFNIKDISKLSTEGFPEKKGVLYRQENCSSFMQPISVEKMLSIVMEPNLGVSMEMFMEADALSLEKIQDLVAAKPKDYSLVEIVCERQAPQVSPGDLLNLGMIATPYTTAVSTIPADGNTSPEINIISLLDSSKDLSLSPMKSKKPWGSKQRLPSTSTPLGEVAYGSCKGNKQLEESYLEPGKRQPFSIFDVSLAEENESSVKSPAEGAKVFEDDEKNASANGEVDKATDECDGAVASKALQKQSTTAADASRPLKERRPVPKINIDAVSNVRPPSLSTPMPLSWTASNKVFRKHMEQKLKPLPPKLQLGKPRLDLLRLCPPLTPMTPALKEVLTPTLVPNLVPLNHLRNDVGKPLYVVHPASGITWMFEALGTRLSIPCYGIQRTSSTPADSINSVASYYRNAIEMMQPSGPYRIGGYSYGSMIALEMALQLQAEGKKVGQLLLLDGSPMYVHAQMASAMKLAPVNATKAQLDDALEVGALQKWVLGYRNVSSTEMLYEVLRKLKTLDERLNTAVDFTFGDAIISCSPKVTQWLKAGKMVMNKRNENVARTDNFASVAKEIIRLKRRERAADFLTHVKMAQSYTPGAPYEGDIHLHRIKAAPNFACPGLTTDYGLHSHCTGKVHIALYDGDHESFLTKESLTGLVKNIHESLGVKES